MKDSIKIRADESIRKRNYLSGQETCYYILTIKLNSSCYLVKVLEHHMIIATSEIEGRLDSAKKEGIRVLLQINPSIAIEDVTMVHYKDDRPNGEPWNKDSVQVIKQLLALERTDLVDAYNVTDMTDKLKDVTGGSTDMKSSQPINKILYGPPGTGKTYNVIYEALSILNPDINTELLTAP